MKSDQKRWNERFSKRGFALGREPNLFLKRHVHLLPKGRALDLATGEGKNAVFLARQGWDVDAVDISPMGLKKARRLAQKNGVAIRTHLADLDTFQIERERYDVILDFYFLSRRLIPKIKKGLKRGGRVIFETYLVDQRHLRTGGPKDPKYFLQHNELLQRFKDFRIVFYREGIFKDGGKQRALASLIAEKT